MKGKIIINPIGGLANRMRSIASGVSLCQQTGLEFLIIWRCDNTLNAKFEDLFETGSILKGKIAYPDKTVYNIKYSVPRKKNLFISKILLNRFGGYRFDEGYCHPLTVKRCESEDEFRLIVKEICEGGKDFYISSGLTFYEYDDNLYRRLFTPREDIIKEAQDIIKRGSADHIIGMHIRRTDNKQSIFHSPDELFINKVRNELQKHRNLCIYLATDDETVKEKFKDTFGEKIIVNSSCACRKSLDGMKNAMTELSILSMCEKIYGSYYSSFSEAAALLGNVELEQLTADLE